MHTPNPSKSLDMGKGCVRSKKWQDLALDVINRTVVHVFVEENMANFQAARAFLGRGKKAPRSPR